jgi:hypothetical protein
VLPWLKGAEHKRVQVMRDYIRVAFHRVTIGQLPKRAIARKIYEWIAPTARWRLDHDFYLMPVEVWMKHWADGLSTADKKPAAPSGGSEAVAC